MIGLLLAAMAMGAPPDLAEVQRRAWMREGVAAVAEGLDSEDPAVKRETVRLLGQLRDDIDVHVAGLVSHETLGPAAAEALALSTTEGAQAVLAAWATVSSADPAAVSPQVQLALLDGLGRRGDAGVIGHLVSALNRTARPDLARAAALALGRLGRRKVDGANKAVEPLVSCVETRAQPVVQACGWALARIGVVDVEPGLVRRLSLAAPKVKNGVARAWVVRAIATDGPAPEWAHQDPVLEVRVAALTGKHVPFEAAVARLDDPEPWVAAQALQSLTNHPSRLVEPILRPRLGRARAPAAAAIASVLVAAGVSPKRGDLADPRGPVRATWLSRAPANQLPALLPPPIDPAQALRPATTQDWAALGVSAAVLERAEDIAALESAEVLSDKLIANGRPVCWVAAAGLAGARQDLPTLVQLLREGDGEVRMAALAAMVELPASTERDEVLTRVAASGAALEARMARAALGDAAPEAWTPPTLPLDPPRAATAQTLVFHTNRGRITIALEPDIAPRTVDAVLTMARDGRYDGTVTHRVVPAFVAQGGDPTGTGWGGPGWSVPDEDSLRPFDLGAVGMAKAGPDTGGSQWFITTVEQPHLTGDYTRFGHVVDGIEVARDLRPGDVLERVEVP